MAKIIPFPNEKTRQLQEVVRQVIAKNFNTSTQLLKPLCEIETNLEALQDRLIETLVNKNASLIAIELSHHLLLYCGEDRITTLLETYQILLSHLSYSEKQKARQFGVEPHYFPKDWIDLLLTQPSAKMESEHLQKQEIVDCLTRFEEVSFAQHYQLISQLLLLPIKESHDLIGIALSKPTLSPIFRITLLEHLIHYHCTGSVSIVDNQGSQRVVKLSELLVLEQTIFYQTGERYIVNHYAEDPTIQTLIEEEWRLFCGVLYPFFDEVPYSPEICVMALHDVCFSNYDVNDPNLVDWVMKLRHSYMDNLEGSLYDSFSD